MHIFSGITRNGFSINGAILTSLLLGMWGTPAAAAESASAVSQGMGGTVRANPWDPMTAHAAPGMVWLDGRFELGVSGRYGNDETSLWQVGAYDAQTTRVGFGVFWSRLTQSIEPKNAELPGWRREDQEFDNYIRSSVLSTTIGGGGIHRLFGFGVGVRYFYRSTKLGGSEHALTLAPSIATVIQDSVIVSITAENVIPTGNPDAPLGMSTGTRWQISRQLALAFDTEVDFESVEDKVAFTPMVGAEFRAGDVVPLRAGWRRDGVDGTRWLTGGIGVENESVGLSYGLSLDLSSGDEAVHQHGVMLRISM